MALSALKTCHCPSTNYSIAVKVRFHGFAVLGVRVRRPGPVATVLLYAFKHPRDVRLPSANGDHAVPVATILFGIVPGMVLNVLRLHWCISGPAHCSVGAALASYDFGRHQNRWVAIDEALRRDGWHILPRFRARPSRQCAHQHLLALTSISQTTFVWTLCVGEIVTSFPYAYAAHIGTTLASSSGRGRDLSCSQHQSWGAANVAVAWKISMVAKSLLEERSHDSLCRYEKAEAGE